MNAGKFKESLLEYERHCKGEISLRTSHVIPPAVDVRRVREGTGLSQKEFAMRYGFSLAAVRNWEQGSRNPEGPARSLLVLIQQNPERIAKDLKRAIAG